MSTNFSPALTAEQWESRDYRQSARELDVWAKTRSEEASAHDSTEYVAKLGLDESGTVVVMNRAHDRVLVPPPARAVLAAFALADQPFGVSRVDTEALELAATSIEDEAVASALRALLGRLRALLPPAA